MGISGVSRLRHYLECLVILAGISLSASSGATLIDCSTANQRLRLLLADQGSEKLAELPTLKSAFTQILDDRFIPVSVRKMVTTALARKDTTVRQLTNTLESALRQTPGIRLHPNVKFEIIYRATPAQATAETVARNDLITLTHELSHVRFDHFLNKKISKIARVFPDDLVHRLPNGKYSIDDQLMTYLSERFAFETEFKLTRGEVDQTRVAALVVKKYKITDPRIIALNDLSISESLNRKLFKKAQGGLTFDDAMRAAVSEEMQAVQAMKGTVAEKVARWKKSAVQFSKYKEGWAMAEFSSPGGQHLFVGRGGYALFIDAQGNLFRGLVDVDLIFKIKGREFQDILPERTRLKPVVVPH